MPVTVSCCIHLDIIVAMVVPAKKTLCHGQFLWDINGYVWGDVFPQGFSYLCKTRQWHLPLCNGAPQWCFHHWLEIVEVPVLWLETVEVFAIGVMVSFEHPILWVTGKEPRVWAL